MIRIRNLAFAYAQSVFDLQIDELQIQASSATAMVGPSGSGKTTLLNIIAGILSPDSGCVSVMETDLAGLSDAARRRFRLKNIGLVFQEFELIDYLNVLDNVLLPCRVDRAFPLTSDRRDRAAGLIEDVGLKDHLKKSVTRLSQGERQRVAICRALLMRPPLLLADEPTGNLDPVTSDQIVKLLLRAVQDEGTTLLMVTHNHSLLHHFSRTIDFAEFLTTSARGASVEESRR
ncbi:MAG: ABC transporter ATP-binding protein [Fuerstiella sp.]